VGTGYFVNNKRVTATKRVEVSVTESYINLRSRWCNVIILNVHSPSEEKSDDLKTAFMRN